MEPFYMTYPMQNLFQAEMEYEKDLERMKEMYPKEVTKILVCIEDRCDELEFEGSRIYDENPDRIMMEQEALALYDKIKEMLREESQEESKIQESTPLSEDTKMQGPVKRENFALVPPEDWLMAQTIEPEARCCKQAPVPPGRKRECNDWLCSMVGILFQNEIYRRRCRYRRCRRWW